MASTSSTKNGFKCDLCSKVFRDKYNLTRHVKIHNEPNEKCYLKTCDLCAKKVDNYDRHLTEAHSITLEKQTLTFCNAADFESWKLRIEQDTKSIFVKHFAPFTRKDGSAVIRYYCHRDGKCRQSGKGIRTNKTIKSNKINSNCPANIKCIECNESIQVEFTNTHVGHECEVGRMILSSEEKERIASKIAMKVPLDEILNDIQNSAGDEVQRIDLSTKKDLRNIIRKYGLDEEGRYENYAVAVDNFVKRMKALSEEGKVGEFVRLYKPQGEICSDIPQLQLHDFCLILANNIQLNVLQRFGNDVMCIDGTHGLTGYDFQMFTVLVLDDMRSGYPCAFMFSNRSDTKVIELFFKTILDPTESSISPNYFMSDLDDTFFNAWCAVVPDNSTQHLYCAWHMDRAFQKNLSKVKTEEMKDDVYKKLKVLMVERDRAAFHKMSQNFMEELYKSDLTKNFAMYLERYIHQPSKWAYCYRLQAGLNTNNTLESFHRVLKHIYLAGKKVKKLIKSIHALQAYLQRIVFKDLNSIHRGHSSKKLSMIRNRHKRSLEMSTDIVHEVNEQEWNVFSGTDVYNITLIKHDCGCKLRCDDCTACLHSFSCTCADSNIAWNMCKHIHLVSRKTLLSGLVHVETQEAGPSHTDKDIENFLLQEIRKGKRENVYDLEFAKKKEAEKMLGIINNIQSEAEMKAFRKVVMSLEVEIKSAKDAAHIQSFPMSDETSAEPANKNICPQRKLSFHSTQKKRKRALSHYKNPSKEESKTIAIQLFLGSCT